jgi:glycosidase
MSKIGMLLNRDECRSPMQWHGGDHAGFAESTARPWLSLHPRAGEVNVDAQERDPESLLTCYRGLLALRKQCRPLSEGSLELLQPRDLSPDVVAYRRALGGGESHEEAHVYLNFGPRRATVLNEPLHGQCMFSNLRADTSHFMGEYVLSPYEGIVLFEG